MSNYTSEPLETHQQGNRENPFGRISPGLCVAGAKRQSTYTNSRLAASLMTLKYASVLLYCVMLT